MFDLFGLFGQLRACNVSVVASGVCFHVGKSIVRSKAVWRGPGSLTLMYFWNKKRGKDFKQIHVGVSGMFCIINYYFECFYEIH